MQRLIILFSDSDFFDGDLNCIAQTGCVSLIDVAVESVCECLEHFHEKLQSVALVFIGDVIKATAAILSTNSLQKITHAIFFIASFQSSSSKWSVTGLSLPVSSDGASELTCITLLRNLVGMSVSRAAADDVPNTLPGSPQVRLIHETVLGCARYS